MWVWISIAIALAVGLAGWILVCRFGVGHLEALIEQRRTTSRVVGRGELVDGNRHIQVALAVTQSTFFYENRDMQASLDLHWVREVEYDTELATGTTPPSGRVLRLRTVSQTFEFVLPAGTVARWHLMLPPRRTNERALGVAQAVAAS
jgi:hypothetical protein